ncbi:polysaccharide pyruvyl transferase family protein [uncultured Bacteroides sp.]|uniref:polysaccharide pyruvyl transferase family protein n=1 Tax=uncultured Bacteroides sp. TaxID=162156 RepID=UPI0025CF06C3|nr:polysaccharide pyruvyl transferase family protein [uncultured Bacteroides sp.]
MKKIVIAEAGPSFNVGSMALIENAVKIAREIFEATDVVVLTPDIDGVRNTLNRMGYKDVIVINDVFRFKSGLNTITKLLWLVQSVLWIFYAKIITKLFSKAAPFFTGKKKDVFKHIDSADAVICIGAERINDVYFKTALLSLYALEMYQNLGKKLIHMSLTIGPVFYSPTIWKAKRIMKRSAAIVVRDQKSYDILKDWGVNDNIISRSYDIAMLQSEGTDNVKKNIIERYGLLQDKDSYVAVSTINWKFRCVQGPVRQDGYEQAVAELLDYIISKYKRRIVFTNTVVPGDAQIAEKVITRMKYPEYALNIKELLSPEEMVEVFSHAKYAVVTRMHAAILASGAGRIPVIAVNYLYKLREYMKNIGMEDMSVDIDVVTSDELISITDRMESCYEEVVTSLNNRRDIIIETINKHLNSLNI